MSVPLDTATVQQLIDELCRRHGAVIVGCAKTLRHVSAMDISDGRGEGANLSLTTFAGDILQCRALASDIVEKCSFAMRCHWASPGVDDDGRPSKGA